ncbi:hypothetical protein AF71_00053150 [Rhizobium sp. 57MFTsu3.2]|nr:hypothetical protein [Rhizobium sp. 57MFTsu3.2]
MAKISQEKGSNRSEGNGVILKTLGRNLTYSLIFAGLTAAATR